MKGAITHSELATMPIAERNWYIKRLQKQFDDEAKTQRESNGESDPDRPLDEHARRQMIAQAMQGNKK